MTQDLFSYIAFPHLSNNSASEVAGWFKKMGIDVMQIFKDAASVYGRKTVRE